MCADLKRRHLRRTLRSTTPDHAADGSPPAGDPASSGLAGFAIRDTETGTRVGEVIDSDEHFLRVHRLVGQPLMVGFIPVQAVCVCDRRRREIGLRRAADVALMLDREPPGRAVGTRSRWWTELAAHYGLLVTDDRGVDAIDCMTRTGDPGSSGDKPGDPGPSESSGPASDPPEVGEPSVAPPARRSR